MAPRRRGAHESIPERERGQAPGRDECAEVRAWCLSMSRLHLLLGRNRRGDGLEVVVPSDVVGCAGCRPKLNLQCSQPGLGISGKTRVWDYGRQGKVLGRYTGPVLCPHVAFPPGALESSAVAKVTRFYSQIKSTSLPQTPQPSQLDTEEAWCRAPTLAA